MGSSAIYLTKVLPFYIKKRHNYGTVMIDIETHKIIDMIESRQEDDVTEWLKTYTKLEIISRDGGIVYKSASDKVHHKAYCTKKNNDNAII